MIHRVSVDASVCFTVRAATEAEAIEKARAILLDKMPDDFPCQTPSARALEIVCYVNGSEENLEVESSWEE